MKSILALVFSITVFALPVKSQQLALVRNIGDFVTHCEPRRQIDSIDVFEAIEIGQCIGISNALSQWLYTNCAFEAPVPDFFKANISQVRVGQRQQAMWNWARENPDVWDRLLTGLTMPIVDLWPCE